MIRLPFTENEPQAGAGSTSIRSDGVGPEHKSSANESGFGDAVASTYDSDWAESTLQRSDLMPYAVRMVTPMRREFGRSMDVTHFLYDMAYARDVIAQAKTSRDARLRGYASFLEIKLLGQAEPATVDVPGAVPVPVVVLTHAGLRPDKPTASADFARAKAYAAESLSQLLGPSSERLCRRIASVADMAGFVDIFDRAYSVVREIHGADEAMRYGAAVEARLGAEVSIPRK